MTGAPNRAALDEVLADLAIESDLLDAMVAPLDEHGWHLATPADGWDVALQIAHLAWTDEVAVLAATGAPAWRQVVDDAMQDPTGFVDRAASRVAAAGPEKLLHRWRSARTSLTDTLASYPDGQKISWFGPPMSATSMATARFMETWAHSLDVADALGVPVTPSDRIRHVVHLGVRTRDFAFRTHGLEAPAEPFRVELEAPGGGVWTFGPQDATQVVRGPAYDFCLLVTQRAHREDLGLAARGQDAARWLEIAQAFAGPPGRGRERR
jgi:uncharacterized protein (TIGR03084 family)